MTLAWVARAESEPPGFIPAGRSAGQAPPLACDIGDQLVIRGESAYCTEEK